MVDETTKRHPIFQAVAYTPFAVGTGYAFNSFRKGLKGAVPTAYDGVRQNVADVARGVLEHGHNMATGKGDLAAALVVDMDKAHSSLKTVGEHTRLLNQPTAALRSFASTINNPAFRQEKSAVDRLLGTAFKLAGTGDSGLARFMSQEIRGLGREASLQFKTEFSRYTSSDFDQALRVTKINRDTFAPRYSFSSDIGHKSIEMNNRLDNILGDNTIFKSLEDKGFSFDLAGEVTERRTQGVSAGAEARWMRVQVHHKRVNMANSMMVAHIPLNKRAAGTALIGKNMMPINIGALAIEDRKARGGRRIVRGADLQEEMFRQQALGAFGGLHKGGRGNIWGGARGWAAATESVSSIGVFDPFQATRGQRALSLLRGQQIYAAEAVFGTDPWQRENMLEFGDQLTSNLGHRVEFLGPEQLAKGGMLDPNLRLGSRNINLSKLFWNQESFDTTDRPFQLARDMGFKPIDDLAAAYGVSGLNDGYAGIKLPRLRRGNRIVHDRFRGVGHTREMEKFIRETGYVTPHTLVMHTTNEESLKKFSQSDGTGLMRAVVKKAEDGGYNTMFSQQEIVEMVKADMGIKPGETMTATQKKRFYGELRRAFDSSGFGNLLRFEAPVTYKIKASSKESSRFLAHPGIQKALENQSTRLANPIQLHQGQELGLSPEGGVTRALRQQGVTESIVGVGWDEASDTLLLHGIQTAESADMIKVYGPLGRVSLRPMSGAQLNKVAAELSGDSSPLAKALMSNVNVVTASSKAASGQKFAVQEQVVGGLMAVLENRGQAGMMPQGSILEQMHETMFKKAYGTQHGYAPMENLARFVGATSSEDLLPKIINALEPELNKLTPFEVGGIFGMATTAKAAGKDMDSMRSKIAAATSGGNADKRDRTIAALKREYGFGIHGMYAGESGSFREIRRGSVERRNLEILEALMQDPKTEKLAKAMYSEVLSATMTPEKIDRFSGLTEMSRSFMGKTSDADLKKLVPESEWVNAAEHKWAMMASGEWEEAAKIVKMDPRVVEKAKEFGFDMGNAVYLPSRASLARAGGAVRTRSELHYENLTKKLGRAFLEVQMGVGDVGGKNNAELHQSLENLQRVLVESQRAAYNEMYQGQLAPGAEYLRAAPIDLMPQGSWKNTRELQQHLSTRGIVTKAQVVEQYGSRQTFVGAQKARDMMRDAEVHMNAHGHQPWWNDVMSGESLDMAQKAGMQGKRTYKQAWQEGYYMMPALLTRPPAERLGSLQHTFVGISSTQQAHVIVGETFAKASSSVQIPGWKAGQREINIGTSAGMVMDYDGDQGALALVMNKKNVGEFQDARLLASKDLEKASAKLNTQTQIIRDYIVKGMTVQGEELEAAGQGLSRIEKERVAAYIAKGEVGGVSNAMSRMRVAMTAQANNPELLQVANIMLTEMVETGTLKAKKFKVANTIARDLSRELATDRLASDDISGFLHHMKAVLEKGGMMDEQIKATIDLPGVGQVDVVLPKYEEVFALMQDSWTRASGSGQTEYMDLIRMERYIPTAQLRQAEELMHRADGIAEQQLASTVSGHTGRNIARDFIEEIGPMKKAMEKLGRINMSKKWAMPAMVGMAATAGALAFLGGPGYSPDPIVPKGVQLDPSVNKAIQDGTLLMAAQGAPNVPPDSLAPPYSGGGPGPTPMMGPTARVTTPSSHIHVSGHGDLNNTRLDRYTESIRSHFNNANINSRIRDDRRPLTPRQAGGY